MMHLFWTIRKKRFIIRRLPRDNMGCRWVALLLYGVNMERIDRLLLKATRLKPAYEDIFIISNESGTWKIGKEEFSTLEAAEQYIDGITESNDVLLIINDAGTGEEQQWERRISECGEDQIKNEHTDRGAPDALQSYEYGGKRGDGQQDSKYDHIGLQCGVVSDQDRRAAKEDQ